MIKILHSIDNTINKGHIIDLSRTVKLRITRVVERKEETTLCETTCEYEIVVNTVPTGSFLEPGQF